MTHKKKQAKVNLVAVHLVELGRIAEQLAKDAEDTPIVEDDYQPGTTMSTIKSAIVAKFGNCPDEEIALYIKAVSYSLQKDHCIAISDR